MASNIVEILIGAKDDAKLDLDALKAKLDELAHKVADAQVNVKGDKEAEVALDRLGVKLIQIGKRTANPKVSLEGQFKALAELGALDVALDRVKAKAGDSSGGGLVGSLRNLAMQGSTAMETLGSAGTTFINPITIMLAGLAAIISGPLLASLLPITLGFVAFGGVAVSEITKVIAAHQKLQAAQAAYAKATTPAGQASALKAEQAALAGLSGPEKQVMGLMDQLGKQFQQLSKAVQPEVIKAFGSALKIVKDLMPAITPLAKAAGNAINGFLQHIDSWLRSDSGKKFLKWMEVDGPKAIQTFGRVMWDVAQGIGRTFDFLRNAGNTWWKNFMVAVHGVEAGWRAVEPVVVSVAHGVVAAFDWLKGRAISDFHAAVSGIEGAWAGVYYALVRPIQAAYQTIAGIIGGIRSAISSVGSAISGLGGISGALGHLGLASGGIAGAATGGIRANMTLVGEHGPELVQLSAGSRVYNNAQTQRMMAGGGGPSKINLTVNLAGKKVGDVVIDLVQGHVRNAGGGDVQVALGTSW